MIKGILGDSLPSLISLPLILTKPGTITDSDKAMNPWHFGSDLADIRIWIRINPEMRIRIVGSLSADISALAVALSECSSLIFFSSLRL